MPVELSMRGELTLTRPARKFAMQERKQVTYHAPDLEFPPSLHDSRSEESESSLSHLPVSAAAYVCLLLVHAFVPRVQYEGSS